jgi:tetratricopeptide (TPR) repeat protein
MNLSPFSVVDELLSNEGMDAALEYLAKQFRDEKKFHPLFDVRLMQTRYRLGLPLTQSTAIDELSEPMRTQLEDAYVAHCGEVGALFLQSGQLREAWMYLRPTGDKAVMAAGLERLTVTPENLESVVEIALHEGVSPQLGYRLVLENYGTCNAITLYDSIAHALPPAQREALAGMLVRHVHAELTRNVRADIERREAVPPPNDHSLPELISSRPELFAELNYHVDASHLAATVKSARLLTEPGVLRLAWELADYGSRLDRTYQYPGEGPFADHYQASLLFIAAQLGQQVEEALSYFRQAAAETSDRGAGAEVLIALLFRLQRYDEALDAWQALLSSGGSSSGFAPHLMELARASGRYERVAEIYRERGDVVNYLAARAMAGAGTAAKE